MRYVFLVAREPRVVSTVMTTLGMGDYRIGRVESAAKAAEVLEHVLFDCLLIHADLLDNGDGRLADMAMTRKIPFLMLVDRPERLSVLQRRSRRYLYLPFDLPAFEARFAEAAGKPEPAAEATSHSTRRRCC